MRNRTQKYIVFLTACIVVLSFFLIPHEAHASWFSIDYIATKAMGGAVLIVGQVILFVVGLLIKFSAGLITVGLTINQTLLTLRSDGFVVTGWVIIRDFANLGFVLGIIIIAVATILRVKSYAASQILWKLVVAALLVNFSLVITMPFLQVSNTLSNIFLKNIAGGDGASDNVSLTNLSKRLGDFTKSGALVNPAPDASSTDAELRAALQDLSAAQIKGIISVAIGIFIGAAVFMVFLGLAVSLLFRYFVLAFLLILAPAAWLLWIFPGTSSHFKKWWDKFLEWIFFPPIVLFFIYLALKINSSLATSEFHFSTNASFGELGYFSLDTLGGAVIAVGFLLGGMIAASSIGGAAAKMSTGGAQKVADYTKKKAGDLSSRGASHLMQTKVGQNVVGGTRRILGKVPIVGDTLHQKVIEGQQAIEKRANRQTEDAKGRFAHYSDQQLRETWKSGDARDRAAMLDLLASKDKLGLLDDLATHHDYLNAYGTLRQGGNGKAVGDIAKKRGMSEDMMILATGGKVYEKDRDGRVKTDDSGKPIEVSYQGAAEKFYGSLDRKDWTSLAKTSGGALLKGEPILGFDKNQSELIRGQYVKNILRDETGKAVSGTAPGLKDSKSLEAFYQTMMDETAEEANQLSKDPTWSGLMAEAIEKSEGNREELLDRIQAGMTILPDSVSHADKARLERRLGRIKNSMASALGGFHEFGDESKDEKKGGDDTGKKAEGKK